MTNQNDETDIIYLPICPYKYEKTRKAGMYYHIDKTICDDCEGRGSYEYNNRLVSCSFFTKLVKQRLEEKI